MKRKLYIQKSCLVFRRWSRKAWAVRASIGQQVRIGQLSADVCNATYSKTVRSGLAVSLLIADCLALGIFFMNDSDDAPPGIVNFFSLQNTQIINQTINPIATSARIICGRHCVVIY